MIQLGRIETLGRRVRFVVLLLALFTFSLSAVNAQERRVTLTGRETTLEDLITQIEAQTGYIFGIDNSITDIRWRVSVAPGSVTTAAVLNSVLGRMGQTYAQVDNYILLLRSSDADKPIQNIQNFRNTKGGPIILREDELRDIPLNVARRNAIPVAATEMVSRVGAVSGSAATEFVPDHIQQVVVNTPQKAASGSDYNGGLMKMYTRPKLAAKINLLYGFGAVTPNLSMELGLGNKSTLELGGSYNPWNLQGKSDDNAKLVHWIVGAEARYWFCERFNGHFLGFNGFVSQYNVSERDIPFLFEKPYRYEGTAYSLGVSYGYHWMWARHWGMEFQVGMGVVVLNYDKYDCERCANFLGNYNKTAFMPTRAGISLVYLIK